MTAEEDQGLDGYALSLEGGYYYMRGERDILPRSVLTDPALAALAVGTITTDPPGESTTYRMLGRIYSPYSEWEPHPTIGGYYGPDLARHLNDAANEVSWRPGVRTFASSYAEQQEIPVINPELATMLNVKTWQVTGSIGDFSFDEVIAAGEERRIITGEDVSSHYVGGANTRSGFGFRFDFSEIDDGDPGAAASMNLGVGVWRNLGGFGGRTAGVLARYQSDIPRLTMMPFINIFVTHREGSVGNTNTAIDPSQTPANGSYSEIYESDFTFLGLPVMLQHQLIAGASEPPLTMSVTPQSYWGTSDPWRGAGGSS